MNIDFVTQHTGWPWARQVPRDGRNAFRFGSHGDADWLVVYDDLAGPIETRVPIERRVVVVSEPPGMKDYPRPFLEQFGVVLSPMPIDAGRARVLQTQVGLPWFLGIEFQQDQDPIARWNLDALRALSPLEGRASGISVVISNKTKLAKHRERLDFVHALKERLGDRLAIFGRGFSPIQDKAEAILPFRYHLVLENSDIDHFWTEKTADAFLGWTLPVFSGCSNLGDYFPAGSFVPIAIGDRDGAIAKIEALLAEDPWDQRCDAIAEARRRLFTDHNLFVVLDRLVEASPLQSRDLLPRPAVIKPCKQKSRLRAWRKRLSVRFRAVFGQY